MLQINCNDLHQDFLSPPDQEGIEPVSGCPWHKLSMLNVQFYAADREIERERERERQCMCRERKGNRENEEALNHKQS